MSQLTELILRSQQGDQQASEQLVMENAGLIWSVAKRFLGRGTEADDLYQLGCLGFLKAVEGESTSRTSPVLNRFLISTVTIPSRQSNTLAI